jgi:hypothetical protein
MEIRRLDLTRQVLRIVQWSAGANVNIGESAGGLRLLANGSLTVMTGIQKGV